MFPLVSVLVRQRGAWKLHPYNLLPRSVYYCHSGYNLTNFEAHEIAADMTHADMHAFTITLHQIHTQMYLCSSPSYLATIGYFFTRHVPHYNRNTYMLLYKLYNIKILLTWTMCPMKFSHSYLTTLFVLHFTPQHTMMDSICNLSVQISNVSCSITSKNCL